MNLYEESKENGKIERIEKYIESDAIEDIIMNFIIDNDFKEKCQKSYLFNHEFDDAGNSCDDNKTFKFELFKTM